jgi:hypothetical protein
LKRERKKGKSARPRQGRWVRKSELDDRSGLGLPTIPTQIISNEEFVPPPQTENQKRVEHHLTQLADRQARRLGISRRQFLATTGGMAAAFVSMNTVFGNFFDADASEMLEVAAYDEKWPKNQFIFDVQTHHVATGRQIKVPHYMSKLKKKYRAEGGLPSNTQYGWVVS